VKQLKRDTVKKKEIAESTGQKRFGIVNNGQTLDNV